MVPSVARKVFLVLLFTFVLSASTASARKTALGGTPVTDLVAKAQVAGEIDLIVGLRLSRPFRAEGKLKMNVLAEQRHDLRSAQERVRRRHGSQVFLTFDSIPFMLLRANAATVSRLGEDDDVASLEEDRLAKVVLADTTARIGVTQLWSMLDGSGWTIAQLDTGVEKTHPFLENKVVDEACFSRSYASNAVLSTCPDGIDDNGTYPGVLKPPGVLFKKQFHAGAAAPCDMAISSDCGHGTTTAGVAVGANGSHQSRSFSGVAKGSTLLPIQVFSYVNGQLVRSFLGDQIRALVYIYETARFERSIAAVTISVSVEGLGYTNQGECDAAQDDTTSANAYTAAVANLRSVGIPVVMGAGNTALQNGPAFPSCILPGISVGGVTKADNIWAFTNSGDLMDLWAPAAADAATPSTGDFETGIVTSWPGGGYIGALGTSIATPHVAGAFALLRQRWPAGNVEALINGVLNTGPRITNAQNGVTKRRLDVFAAVRHLVHADFNGDALGDLVWENRSATPANAFWFTNLTNVPVGTPAYTGNASFPASPAGWRIVGTGDFNVDRKADLLLHHVATGQVAVWYMNGSSYQSSVLLASLAPMPWTAAAVADFDRNGWDDIAWRNTNTGENAVWLMNGAVVANVVSMTANADLSWRIVGAGHFNGDDSVDLVWRNDAGDATAVWLMNGTTYSHSVLLPATGDTNWRIEAVGDFNREGNTDLVWRNHVTGANAVWLMNGTTYVTSVSLPSVADPNWYIAGPR